VARQITDFTWKAFRAIVRGGNWKLPFEMDSGGPATGHEWFVDIGDMTYIRIATTANPGVKGLFTFPWSPIGVDKIAKDVTPLVLLRLDIGRLAWVLAG
jgi:hypothetical protein